MEKKKQPVGRCEECEFYDYDEELDAYVCDVSLDEDEMAGNILNERMRFDFGTLLPELSGNNIRYTTFQSNIPFGNR